MSGNMRVSLACVALPLLCSCVTSKDPILGPDSRVLPFASPMKFQLYERGNAREPWVKRTDVTLVADNDLSVRHEGSPNEIYTFHPLSFGRFLIQSNSLKDRYTYTVLEVRNGEGIVSLMACDRIDQNAFKAAGGRVISNPQQKPDPECQLDKAQKPLELLAQLASRPVGPEYRYVPIR
jgi:hypothetical protein